MAGSLPRAYQLAREREFPLPVTIAGNVQLYDRAKVRTWIDQRDQQPPTKAQERRRKYQQRSPSDGLRFIRSRWLFSRWYQFVFSVVRGGRGVRLATGGNIAAPGSGRTGGFSTGYAPRPQWCGTYCSNDYQEVTDTDARNLAKALRRAIGCAISLKYPPGAATGYKPANEMERSKSALAAAKAIDIEHATAFAIFCEAGGFHIG